MHRHVHIEVAYADLIPAVFPQVSVGPYSLTMSTPRFARIVSEFDFYEFVATRRQHNLCLSPISSSYGDLKAWPNTCIQPNVEQCVRCNGMLRKDVCYASFLHRDLKLCSHSTHVSMNSYLFS